KDVKDIRIHYIANNGSEEVVSDLDVTDEYGHCYYQLKENPFDAPEGKYFVGWKVGDKVYPEKEYIHIDEDIDAIAQWKDKPVLTIKTTSISGVGKDGIEDYKITNIDPGTKLGDLLYGVELPSGGIDHTKIKPDIEAHFAKTGYLLKTFIPNPISEYETWDDLPNTTTTGDFMSSKINDDLTVYAIMANEMDSFKISIAEPACGQSVQDTTPEIDTMDGSHYSLSDDGYGATWNSTANVFHYGDEYSADIRLIPEIGFVFTTNPTGNVENGEVDGTPSYDDLNDKLFFSLTVHASQTKHINLTKYDRVEPTCTEAGEEERWLCPGCEKYYTDENATTEMTEQDIVIEKLGHLWSDTEYTWNEDNTEVTATRSCQRDNCTETETETVEATSEVTKEATETDDGEIVYTSKEFENEEFEVQIKKEVIPAKGKTDPEEDDPGKDDPSGKTDPGKDDPSGKTDPGKTDPGKTDSNKKANTLTVKGKTVKLSVKKLKKKNLVVKKAKAMKITKAQGKVSYKLAGVNKKKFKKYFKVNSKTGKITVKKKLKKGIYKVKIKVTAAGNDKYKKVTKTVTVKVRVK
ncbi:MAG: hypothetical protein K6F55_04550, partial [Eubacterium sp.]|nr:hypothetical protein [Eubacterium sp.]